jgi:hypothetical protein
MYMYTMGTPATSFSSNGVGATDETDGEGDSVGEGEGWGMPFTVKTKVGLVAEA